MICVEALTKRYGDTRAIGDLSFTVDAGEILGLVGPNGAGKTTSLRAIAGVHAPSSGRMTISGLDVVASPLEAKRRLALVPDEPELFKSLSVWEHLELTAGLYRVDDWQAEAGSLLDELEMTERRDTPASDLSRGMRQKTMLACALLLDEPLVGLDPRGMRTLLAAVERRAAAGAAVILSSHLLGQVERLCTRFLILKDGCLVLSGTKQELAATLAQRDGAVSLEQLFFDATEGSGHTRP